MWCNWDTCKKWKVGHFTLEIIPGSSCLLCRNSPSVTLVMGKPNKTQEMSMFKKGIVVGLHIAEWSERKIVNKVGVGKTTVHRIITNYEETGSVETKSRPGRPRSTSEREDRSIKIASAKNPKL